MTHVFKAFFTFTLALSLFALPAWAVTVDGNWKGSGKARLKDGTVEPISCQVRYTKDSGRTFLVDVTCAHAGGTFQVSGRVVQQSKSRLTGRLYSDQYSVAGKVSVSLRGKSQTVVAKSSKGTATLTLRKRK